MKRILIALSVLVAIPSLALAQTAAPGAGCEQTAKDLESKVRVIMEKYDKAAYQQLVADEALLIDSLGQAKTKKQELASLDRSSDFTMESFVTNDVRVRACGETNIVITGKDRLKVKLRGEIESSIATFWFTRIYEKRGGNWQLVFQQLTLLQD